MELRYGLKIPLDFRLFKLGEQVIDDEAMRNIKYKIIGWVTSQKISIGACAHP